MRYLMSGYAQVYMGPILVILLKLGEADFTILGLKMAYWHVC